jgi:hypothetical protein
MAERNARAFTFITLSELVLYCLGLIAYIAFLLIDPEFALPALMIGVLAGIVSGTVQRKILRKPLFPSPLRLNQVNTLLFFIYSVVISYNWGSDRQFYELFDGWDGISTAPCVERSNFLFLCYGILGVVLLGILWLGGSVMAHKGPLYASALFAYPAMAFFCFYCESNKITRHYFPDIHDPTTEAVFLGLGRFLVALCLLALSISMLLNALDYARQIKQSQD